MNTNKIAHLALEAGRIILESGGETYRVEETILKICDAYDLKIADSFVMPTGIMISVTDCSDHTISLVKRIKYRTIDLEKIAQVNDLSRRVGVEKYSIEVLQSKINEINNLDRYNLPLTLFFASIVSFGFTLLFGGSMLDAAISFMIGPLIKFFVIKLSSININDFFINVLGAAALSFLALVSTYLPLHINVNNVIIGTIMLLVPGMAITNAIKDTLGGDLIAGATRAVEAFLIAIGIAVGSGIIFKVWFTITGGTI